MKYLCNCLVFSFLFLAAGLSGQQYRLRLDLGMSGVFNSGQNIGPVAAAGLEALITLSPRTFLVPEAGIQLMHISNTEFVAAPLFIPGQILVDFNDTESYKMKQTSAFVGLGLEQHLHRVRVQFFGRVVKRIADRITFRETTNFPGRGQPDNLFSVTVKPGEVFSQGIQLGTLRYNQDLTLYSGLSVRYDLTEGVELGIAYQHAFGNAQLERRVISFCETCPVDLNSAPEWSVAAQTNTVTVSSRYTF